VVLFAIATAILMAPGVSNEKKEYYRAEKKQDDNAWPILPQLRQSS